MALHIRCPSCGRDLVVAESARGERVTCPRCLAEVSVPPAGGVQTEPTERGAAGPACPRCGRAVEPLWLTCPWCEEPLRGGRPGAEGRPDLDVRRDRQGTGVALMILAVIGGLGILLIGANLAALGQFVGYQGLGVYVVALLFLAGLSTIVVFVRSGGNPGAAGFRRVVVGTLAIAGVIILTVIAVIACVFTVCVAGAVRGGGLGGGHF